MDVLSCFSDSPPPSPTFPEGGNPVLYGEDDNKVTQADTWAVGHELVINQCVIPMTGDKPAAGEHKATCKCPGMDLWTCEEGLW